MTTINATATRLENDGRNWFAVSFSDGDSGTFALTAAGQLLDADGCPLSDMGNAKNLAARRAIESAN